MAAELNESDLDDADLTKVVILQAYVRGFLVRKWLHGLRQDFSMVVEELGLETGLYLHWPSSTVCLPVFTKTKPPISSPRSQGKPDRPTHRLQPSRGVQRTCASVQTESETIPQNGPTLYGMGSEVNLGSPDQNGNSDIKFSRMPVSDQVSQAKDVRDRSVEVGETDATALGTFVCKNRKEILRVSEKFAWTSQSLQAEKVCGHANSGQNSLQLLPSVSLGEISPDKGQLRSLDSTSLTELRKNTALELLWLQQAINSRKNYLKLKAQMLE